jgi:hypothetical protein
VPLTAPRLSAVVRAPTIRSTSEASRRHYAGEKVTGGPSNIRGGYRDNTGGFSTLCLPQRGRPSLDTPAHARRGDKLCWEFPEEAKEEESSERHPPAVPSVVQRGVASVECVAG